MDLFPGVAGVEPTRDVLDDEAAPHASVVLSTNQHRAELVTPTITSTLYAIISSFNTIIRTLHVIISTFLRALNAIVGTFNAIISALNTIMEPAPRWSSWRSLRKLK